MESVTMDTLTETYDLDADLTADAEPDGAAAETTPESFTPDTPEKADWLLGRLADLRGRAARVRDNGEKMARELEHQAAFLEMRYGAALQDFARRELDGGRRKSLRLYNGVIGFRVNPARVVIAGDTDADAAAALDWARANLPDAVSVRETLDRRAVLGLVGERLQASAEGVIDTATGEVLPFATVQPAEEKFYIK